MSVNDDLDEAWEEIYLTWRDGGERGRGLKPVLESLINCISLDPVDPELLSTRVGILRSCRAKLLHSSDLVELGDAIDIIQDAESRLSDLEGFYKKNSSRIHKSVEKARGKPKMRTKRGRKLRYGLSIGLRDYRPPKSKKPSAFGEKMIRHYKRELTVETQRGKQVYKNYEVWLAQQGAKYKDKTSAYTVTRYLLEQNFFLEAGLQANVRSSAGMHPGFNWSLAENVEDAYPDHLLRFIGGLAFAVFTIDDNNRAYPGRRPGIYCQVYPLHSVMSDKVQIGTRSVTFMGRLVGKMELYNSFKYSMRHDDLFLETHPEQDAKTHAEASDFKSVQAAGGIVARRGKIIAIDNVSGHYYPGWKLLRQAVHKIRAEGAFADRALVGVLYKKKTWYFPVGTFLALADSGFDVKKMTAVAGQSTRQIPASGSTDLTDQFEKGWWADKKSEFEGFSSYMKKTQLVGLSSDEAA